MRFTVFVFLTVLTLAACSPNPVKQAQAYKITTEAQQDAANQAQARAYQEQVQKLELEKKALKLEERKALTETIKARMNVLVSYTFRALTFAAFVGILVLLAGASRMYLMVTQAAGNAAILKANLIYIDKATMQFPAIAYQGKGRYMVTDINTGATMQLDTRNPGDAQLIAGALAVRYATSLAQHAASTQEGAIQATVDTPIIQPQIVDVDSLMVSHEKE